MISFEELLALQFFGKELIFWLNSKDAARLKQCSKTMNKLVQMENVLIENEPLIFRRLVFQKKFDLLEKCIPFRINKQQKHPPNIANQLYKGFARIGNLKAIQNLTLQSTISRSLHFGLAGAIESNQIEIVRFFLHSWPFHHENSLSRAFLLDLAYQLNRREILMIFLEYLSKKEDYWKLLFELILKEQQKEQQQPTLDQHHFIEHLFSLISSEYISQHNLSNYLKTLQNPSLMVSHSRLTMKHQVLTMLNSFPVTMPCRITNEVESILNNFNSEEQIEIKAYLLDIKIRWSVFIDDFEAFKSQLKSFEVLWETLKDTFARNTLFEYVVERTIQRNLRLDFFNHCVAIVKKKAKVGGIYPIGSEEAFNFALERTVKSKRFDLFHELINLPLDEKHDKLWYIYNSLPVTLAKFGDLRMFKEFFERKTQTFVFHANYLTLAIVGAISEGNYENLNFLLTFPESKNVKMNSVAEAIMKNGDFDLLKSLSIHLNFEEVWFSMLREMVLFGDEFAVEFSLYLIKNDKKEKEYIGKLKELLKDKKK